MYYPNKVEIEYEGDVVVSDYFDDYLESDCYSIIDLDRTGLQIARDLIEQKPKEIRIEDVWEYVEEYLSDLKHDIENYVYDFIENNYKGDFDREA